MIDTTAKLQMDDNIVIQLGKKLYTHPKWVVILRECLQNALDAGAKSIRIRYTENSLYFLDDGEGMSEEMLLNTFLTVGGSLKTGNRNTVGGFGIAKLAIFSSQDFYVESKNHRLTKEILTNHKPLESIDYFAGTGVFVKDPDLFSFWQAKERITHYLSLVNRGVEIFLNGSKIQKAKRKRISGIGIDKEPKSYWYFDSHSQHTTNLIVRVNGLPLYYTALSYDHPDGATFAFDVKTNLSPYDPKYPFTSTRESFVEGTPEIEKYRNFVSNVNKLTKELQEEKEQKQAKVLFNAEYSIWQMYDPEINERSLKTLSLYEECVKILCNMYGYADDSFGYGLIGENDDWRIASLGFLETYDTKKVFFIRDNVTTYGHIMACAIHEFCHLDHQSHNEQFAGRMTTVISDYLAMKDNSVKQMLAILGEK